jgi:hypothetical protein
MSGEKIQGKRRNKRIKKGEMLKNRVNYIKNEK